MNARSTRRNFVVLGALWALAALLLVMGGLQELPRKTWSIVSKSHRGPQWIEGGTYMHSPTSGWVGIPAGGSGDSPATLSLEEVGTSITDSILAAFETKYGDGLKAPTALVKQDDPNPKPAAAPTYLDPAAKALAEWLPTQHIPDGSLIDMNQDRPGEFSMVTPLQIIERAQAVEMGASFTGVIENPLNRVIPNVRLGEIAVGGFSGLLIGELIDGLVTDRNTNVVIKSVTAVALASMRAVVVSKGAMTFAAGVLLVQVLSDVLPIDRWIMRVIGTFRGTTATSAMRQLTPGHQAIQRQSPTLVSPEADILREALSPR